CGVSHGVEYVGLCFVRGPEDVTRAREWMEKYGAEAAIIAKVERPEAVERLNEIVTVSDGVMIARGDLALETSPEAVPLIQKRIIRSCNQSRTLVITAIQMLESMTTNPRPTRAEASDVANAVLDGTDAVMLSGETAAGRYPVEAVETMARIVEAAERGQEQASLHAQAPSPTPVPAAVCAAGALAPRGEARGVRRPHRHPSGRARRNTRQHQSDGTAHDRLRATVAFSQKTGPAGI